MDYENFSIDDAASCLKLIEELVLHIEDIDIIKDDMGDTSITSKFPNIYYYKGVRMICY